MSFLRSTGSSARACRENRSSICGSENRPQFWVLPVAYRPRNWSGSSMNSTVGATISSKLPVFWPSLNHAAVSRGRFSTSIPIFRHSWIRNTAKSW